jgi:Ca2+-binding RTX toxin-like protein
MSKVIEKNDSAATNSIQSGFGNAANSLYAPLLAASFNATQSVPAIAVSTENIGESVRVGGGEGGVSAVGAMPGAINYATTVNRAVEDFGQGGIGDCWFLASIKSISVSTPGKQILYNVINSSTTAATVLFQGAKSFSYSSTLANLTTEMNDGDTYTSNGHSSGDADTLLLEMALKAYVASPGYKNPYFYSSPYTGGWMDQALSLITGKRSETYSNWYNDLGATSAKLDALAKVIDHTAVTAGCMYQANPSLGIAASGHAYSIVAIDAVNKTVSFRNPWYSGRVLTTLTYSQFSYYFQRVDSVDLTSNNQCLYADNLGGTLTTGTGNDLIYGGSGNDVFNTGAGNDVMYGGLGNDTYYVDNLSDSVVENSGEGTDTVISSVSYTLASTLENLTLSGTAAINGTGNTFNNVITGNASANILNGGIGADTMVGGLGNDTYYVDNAGDIVTENLSAGTDTVNSSISYVLGNNVENLSLSGTAAINGTGNTLNNAITGNAADNILNGGIGADTMVGGLGNDTYYIDNAADIVTENLNAGTDTVNSSISYTLGNNVENLVLTGTAAINGTGNALNNTLTGNVANNILTGGDGSDIINGGAGNDIMAGGLGNDTYYVDSAADIITENLNAGTDTVNSSISYTLGNNVENLVLTGTAAINGTGNALNNTLTGNVANNILTGGDGSDIINGGAGIDTMLGGLGNDTYYVDNAADIITENLNAGTDTVNSSVSYLLGNNVENLILSGAAAVNATGNTLNNAITGNTAANVLNGGVGADTMVGGLGNDTYYVDNAGDIVTENLNEGTDTVNSSISYTLGNNAENLVLTGTAVINGTGNTLNNAITGNTAANILNGGVGADTMFGGLGNDTYYVDNAGDIVTENLNEGTDTVNSSISYTLGNNVENLVLTGTAAINGTGNALNNTLTGNVANNILTGGDGSDIINGGAGNDTMVGGLGNDTYYVDSAADIVTENLNAGTDTVNSSITYTLGNNVENLVLTGTAAINGTGNALNNTLTGNVANNILTGGDGADIMDGGAGSDTLYGNAGNDTYLFNAGSGNDRVSDSLGTDIIKFGSGVLKQSVAFFKQGVDLIAGFANGDRITVSGQSTASTTIERFQLTSGEFLTNTDINVMIQQMSSYAATNGIQLTSVDSVIANQNLMTMVSNSWHAA